MKNVMYEYKVIVLKRQVKVILKECGFFGLFLTGVKDTKQTGCRSYSLIDPANKMVSGVIEVNDRPKLEAKIS
jgi:hypothetical protein